MGTSTPLSGSLITRSNCLPPLAPQAGRQSIIPEEAVWVKDLARLWHMAPHESSYRVIHFVHVAGTRGCLYAMQQISKFGTGIFAVPRSAGREDTELFFPTPLRTAAEDRLTAPAPECPLLSAFISLRLLHQGCGESPDVLTAAASLDMPLIERFHADPPQAFPADWCPIPKPLRRQTKRIAVQTWVPTTADDLYLCDMELPCRLDPDPWAATIRRQDSLMFNGSMGLLNAGHRAAAAPASSTGLTPRVALPRASPKASAKPRQVLAEAPSKDVSHNTPPQNEVIPPPPSRSLSAQEQKRYASMLGSLAKTSSCRTSRLRKPGRPGQSARNPALLHPLTRARSAAPTWASTCTTTSGITRPSTLSSIPEVLQASSRCLNILLGHLQPSRRPGTQKGKPPLQCQGPV